MRMRFSKAEREAFTVGTTIEWRHGRYWYPGVITEPIRQSSTGSGWQELGLINHGPTTRTISKGAYITGIPTHVRLPERAA